MKLIFTFLTSTILFLTNQAQPLTGIWRGYFVQQGFDMFTGQFKEERYKYEIQIENLETNGLDGVTYSYRSTLFYGKAKCVGVYSAKNKTLTLKETKMLELKISDGSEPCLMTCYLDYAKKGKLETLTGTYTSMNTRKKSECGNGNVYLEKVKDSDFEKEAFLTNPKKKTEKSLQKSNNPIAKINKPTEKITNTNPLKLKYRPGAEEFVVEKTEVKEKKQPTQPSVPETPTIKAEEAPIATAPETEKIIPRVLLERKNELVTTIAVSSNHIKIEYYDNGQIDNDTITVYHNNRLAIEGGRLSYNPIVYEFDINQQNPTHEIITVANNLGSIPPNTALMIVTSGKNRYEVFITSDEKKNAKVVIEYKPGAEANIEEKPIK